MNFISAIVTALAYMNLTNAKEEYAKAEEEVSLIEAAIKTYKDSQDNAKKNLEQTTQLQGEGNSPLSGVNVSFILRVGNLVGNKMTAAITLVVSNTTSDRTYSLSDFKAQPYISGMILNYKPEKENSIIIKPGETKEISLPVQKNEYMLVGTGEMDALRKLICQNAGKRLITSCPKVTIDNVAYANVEFEYINTGYVGSTTRAIYRGISGVLRYCGEAYNPSMGVDWVNNFKSNRTTPTPGPGAPNSANSIL